MEKFRRTVDVQNATATYVSPARGEHDVRIRLARVAVSDGGDNTVHERIVSDRIVPLGIPIPAFEARLQRAIDRADRLVVKLNGVE